MENISTDILGNNRQIDPAEVLGWGVDADSNNDPTYPMKRRNNGEHAGYTWERPPQQFVEDEILHSNERPNLSAAFGTAAPPSGISGIIRRAAFKYSENSYGHWLPLMLADRINMIEGVADDLAHGHLPNVLREMGMRAEWRHNKQRVIKRALIAAAVGAVAIAVLRNKNGSPHEIHDETS